MSDRDIVKLEGSESTCFAFTTLLGSILYLEVLSREILSWRSKESF